RLCSRVARGTTLGVVRLGRTIGYCARSECLGRDVVLKRGISPSAAVREPLAIFHHDIGVMEGIRHQRLTWLRFALLRNPMDFGDFGAIGEGLAVSGNP